MSKGQKVKAEGFDGVVFECRLYEVQGKTALVCSEQEWQRATAEGRAPDCLGWPLGSLRELKKSGASEAS